MENSGIVQCITVAFSELYDSRPSVEDGLAYKQLVGFNVGHFSVLLPRAFFMSSKERRRGARSS